jgi:prepilin-type N-terminal cleavage/methylation domain-containing protein
MSVLKLFGFEDLNSVKARLGQISPAELSDPKLKRQLGKLQAKQGGFSLLELLVVVAIIAAIAAGSATMINSADKNAKAAVNADAIDAAFKSIATFKVLNNAYPDKYDSLQQGAALATGVKAAYLNSNLQAMLTVEALSASSLLPLTNVGITTAFLIDGAGAGNSCTALSAAAVAADYTTYLRNKASKALAGDLFKIGTGIPTAPSCGESAVLAAADLLLRVNTVDLARVNVNLAATDQVYAFGIGPSSTLFNPSYSGALNRAPQDSTVPIDKYNRYIALFNVGTDLAHPTEAALVGVASARGKVFDEELGIWNGAL